MADNFLKLQNYTFAFVCTSLKIMICTTARAVRGIFVSPNVAIGAQNERIGGGKISLFLMTKTINKNYIFATET
jgi:hypothetical protein